MIFPVISENEKKLPFYLAGLGCEHRQETVIRPEGYPYFQWIQCYSGGGEVILNNEKFRIGPQQGMLLYPKHEHEYYEVEGEWKVDWICFGGYGVEPFLKGIGIEKSEILSVTNAELLSARIKKISYIANSQNTLKGIECSEVLYGLLTDLQKYMYRFKEESIIKRHFKLNPVLNYIEAHYAEIVSLDDLARTISVTPEYFCVLFKEIMGVRPFEYINQIKISKSKDLILKHRNMTIGEIGKQVGFEDASYFCASFKKIEGISPGKFKVLY